MKERMIKPCHVFEHQGRQYVINIEKMSAAIIDDETAGLIEELTSDSAAAPDCHNEERLKKLDLLKEGGEQSPKAGIEQEPIPLVSMCLFLTQSCNLKCVYCYGEGGKYGTGGSMDEKTAFQAVDWMLEQSGRIKKLHIGFFGGEPFLKFPLMKAVVEYARKRASEAGKDVAFHGTTNATLLDDEIIAFLKEHDITFMVSFDGTKELQDRQRPYADGIGSYDSTVPKIEKLLAAMPKTHGHAIIVGSTDPQTVKDALMEIGFSYMSLMPVSRSLFAGEPDQALQARDTRHLIQEMEEEGEKWITFTRGRDNEALKTLRARGALYNGIISLLHNSRRHHACGAGLTDAAVSCSGDVYLCHRFVGREEYKLGTIFEKELKREEYRKSPVKENNLCTACFARYYCAGGCKHDNVGACGSISKPSEDICRLRCRQLELAAAVVCRLDSGDRAFLVDQEIIPPKPCPFDFQ